jgi:hypothetical protein
MPSKGKGSRQAVKGLHGTELRKFRSDVAKLKASGLVGPRVDARSQKPTRYMRDQVRQYRDVIEGRAKVVKLPRDQAKRYEGTLRVKRSRAVVPVESKAERVTYSKKDRAIVTQRMAFERRIRKVVRPRPRDISDLPTGPNLRYSIPFGQQRGRFTFDDPKELARFMQGYGSYNDWIRYVEIEEIDDLDEAA